MAILYPSNEWCSAWTKVINSSKECAERGAKWGVGFSGSMLFELQPDAGLEKTAYVYINLKEGKASDARLVDDPVKANPGFHCTGLYGQWKRVVKGELDFIEGLVRGIFRLKGDMTKVMRNAKFMRTLADVISAIPDVKYLGE